jgi:WD40 repeat protein/predicted Ser/Thr protein kinase
VAPPAATVPPPATAPTSEVRAEVERAAKDPRKRLGRFLLLSELGRGGMGIVYRAWDDRLRRVVALKTLISAHAPEDAPHLARFGREVEAMARLRHPNIVSIHETGEIEGRRYFVMDLIDGAPFSKRVEDEENPLPLAAAVAAVRDAAVAVHHANEQGIVHRDMKPGNMLVGKDGHVYVIDFGLARLVDRRTRLTKTNAVMGTPAYMPPEQAGEADLPVDRRSDVYSLGATLYFALTGEPPFVRDGAFPLIAAVLTEPPEPPRRKNPSVARDLEAVCLRCLEKKPERRYATALELAQDLDRFLAGAPTVARPGGVLARLAGSRRARLAMPVLGAALLAAGAAAFTLRGPSAESGPGASGASAGKEGAATSAGKPSSLEAIPSRLASASRLGKLRLDALLGSEGARTRLPLTAVAALPDGRHVLAGSRGELIRWDTVTATFDVLGPCDTESIAVTRDGQEALAIEMTSQDAALPPGLLKWKLSDRSASRLGPPVDWKMGRAVAVSGDGTLALTGWEAGVLWLVHVTDGGDVARLSTAPWTPFSVALSADGKTALAGLSDGKGGELAAQYAVVAEGAGTRLMEMHRFSAKAVVRAVAVSADGKRGAMAGVDGSVSLLDLAEEEAPVPVPSARRVEPANQLVFLEDGRLLSGAGCGTVELSDPSGKTLLSMRARASVSGLALLPAGRIAIAGTDRRVSLLDLEAKGPLGRDPGHAASVDVLSCSGDGKHVLSGSRDRTLRLWSLADGAVEQTFVGHARDIGAAALSADGTRAISVARGHEDETLPSSAPDLSVRLWDAKTGDRIAATVNQDHQKWELHDVSAVALSRDGEEAFLAVNVGPESPDGFQRWRTRGKEYAKPVPGLPGVAAKAMASVPGPTFTAFLGTDDQNVALVEQKGEEEPALRASAQVGDLGSTGGSVVSVAAAAGPVLLCGTARGDVLLWSGSDLGKAAPSTSHGHEGGVRGVALSPDGKRAVTAGVADGTVLLWTTSPLKKVGQLELRGASIEARSVAFPDDRTVLVGTDKGLILRYVEGS